MPEYLWHNVDRDIRRPLSHRSGYGVLAVSGLSLPDKDHLTARGPQQHGATYVSTYFCPRECSLTLLVQGCNEVDFEAKHRELVRAFNPLQAGRLHIYTHDNLRYYLNCRPVTSIELNRLNAIAAEALVQLIADDPFFYGGDVETYFYGEAYAGLRIPFIIPGLLDSPGTATKFIIPNDGQVLSYPRISMSGNMGDLVNPGCWNLNTGQVLQVNYTIPIFEVLEIDMGLRTVMWGTTNLLPYMTGDFWALEVGDNELKAYAKYPDSSNVWGTVIHQNRYLAAF